MWRLAYFLSVRVVLSGETLATMEQKLVATVAPAPLQYLLRVIAQPFTRPARSLSI